MNQYNAYQKAAAMTLLERNNGDVQLTAQQTGIPDRTLYDWQRATMTYMQQYAPRIEQPPEIPAFEGDMERLAFIREHIMAEMTRLSVVLGQAASPHIAYQRVLILSQLIDKLMKLDLHLKPYKPVENDTKIRIVFVDEQGVEHNEMPKSDDPEDYEYYPSGYDEDDDGYRPGAFLP